MTMFLLIAYEAICRYDAPKPHYESNLADEVEVELREVGWVRLLVAGGAAGIAGWGSTYVRNVFSPFLLNESS